MTNWWLAVDSMLSAVLCVSCSVRAPRAGGRDRAPEPYGLDAREFLRKKLIGKEVTVKMEYTRKIGFVPGQEQAPAVPGQEVGLAAALRDARPAVPLDVMAWMYQPRLAVCTQLSRALQCYACRMTACWIPHARCRFVVPCPAVCLTGPCDVLRQC